MNLAYAIRGLMAERGITQPELAEQIGMSPATLSTRLNGHTEFTMKEIGAIARAFGVTIHEVVEREERLMERSQ